MTYRGRERRRRGLLSYEIAVLFFHEVVFNLSLEYENNNTARIGISFHLSPDPLSPALSNPQASNNPPPPGGGRSEQQSICGERAAGQFAHLFQCRAAHSLSLVRYCCPIRRQAWRLRCAPFLSARVLSLASLVSVRLVFSRRCCCSIRVRPVVRVGWRRGRGDAWLPRCGRYGMVWPCGRCRGDGRFDDAMRVAERAVRDEERNEGQDEGRAVFVSSILLFPCCPCQAWGPRGVLGLLHRGIRYHAGWAQNGLIGWDTQYEHKSPRVPLYRTDVRCAGIKKTGAGI